MRIVAHLTKFYDWEPVPADVKVTQQDIASGKVKPDAAGAWKMKVTKEPVGGTTGEIMVPEEQIIAKVIHDRTRPEGGRVLSRKEAVAFYVAEDVMPHFGQRSWVKKFEVHDTEKPDEQLLRTMLAPHVADGNIPSEDIESHVKAYLAPASPDEHVAQLTKHFKIKAVAS